MKDIIKLNSRGYNGNSLEKVVDRKYKLTSELCYRAGKTNGGLNFIDPAGGPMMVEGEYLEEAQAFIDTIENGFITFKE